MRSNYIGRFAPSPTGPLHEGSVATALGSWLDARAHGGQWLVRIEDIDTPRTVAGAAEHILHSLEQLGLFWDGEVVFQSERTNLYEQALATLTQHQFTYPCGCTRKEIADSSVVSNRQNDSLPTGLVYPGTCRQGLALGKTARAIRFLTEDQTIEWTDRRLGRQSDNAHQQCGDFVLKRADGLWAYQLAVVVDDEAQEVSYIVRGQDLIDSTSRQLALYKALNYKVPEYLHLPIVLATDGEKLSKQNGAQAVDVTNPIKALNAAANHLGIATHEDATSAQWLLKAVSDWKRLWS